MIKLPWRQTQSWNATQLKKLDNTGFALKSEGIKFSMYRKFSLPVPQWFPVGVDRSYQLACPIILINLFLDYSHYLKPQVTI